MGGGVLLCAEVLVPAVDSTGPLRGDREWPTEPLLPRKGSQVSLAQPAHRS